MLRLEIAALYAGVNILILLALAAVVGMRRGKHKVLMGDGGDAQLARAIRAHGNAAEYVPAGLVGILMLALLEPAAPLWLMHASGLSLTIGRVFHGVGLNLGETNPGRGLGVLLTWIAYALMGGGLLYAGLAQQL